MRHPQGISVHFTQHHRNYSEPWAGKSSVLRLTGPEQPRVEVHRPVSESHSPSSAKDGGAVHCPLSQGICMLKRIITSAKGKAAQHRLSGLSRKGRVCQYEERLPRNTDVTHGGQAAHSGFRLIWTWKGGRKPSARGESSKPELSSHQGLLSCSLSPGLASLSSLQVWTCFLLSSQV